ncbi:unnamed protein product, partial [marine sediment metagenome]
IAPVDDPENKEVVFELSGGGGEGGGGVMSIPPEGGSQIKNIYLDEAEEEQAIVT